MRNRFFIKSLAAGACALALSAGSVQAKEVTLRGLSFLPKQLSFTKSFLEFIDMVNKAGKGVIQIKYIGGPEVMKQPQMGQALKNGFIDILSAPPGIYLNLFPEGDAIFGSTTTPPQERANGGIALLNKIMIRKMNARILAHADGGFGFHLFLKEKPKMKPDGSLDLSGLKLRSSPAWRGFINWLGATVVIIRPPEVYTSLQRGVVDGTGWPINGLRQFKWDKFVKYRIDPEFMKTDIVVAINETKWKSLSPKARKILQDTAIKYETLSYEQQKKITAAEDAALKKEGMKVITLKGKAREEYLKHAYSIPWKRLESRDKTNVEALKAKFFYPGQTKK
jgi:TRAP-type C4-dicarboxylate transport system substrate-binding protein